MAELRTDRYAPDFQVEIEGQPLDFLCEGVKLYVLSLSITETTNQADSFSLTLCAHSGEVASFPSRLQLKCLDDERFNEGHKIRIAMGYADNLRLKFHGHITASSCSFPENGLPTLTVRGYSLYHQLFRRHRREPFAAATDSEIARKIAAEMGLKADVDETSVRHPIVSNQNQSFGEILKSRAERINYELAVKDDTLIFKRPTYLVNASPSFKLTWGEDLRSFQPSLSTYNMPTKVEVLSTQTAFGGDKIAIRGACTAAEIPSKLGKNSGLQRSTKLGENQVLLEDSLVSSAEEARTVARAYCEKRMLEFITARGSSIGDPSLLARRVIEVNDLGSRFSGKYYVTSTTHTIDTSGYRTDFEAKRDGR